MGGKSAPKAPDYAAAAEQQAQSSREVTEQQTWANRPDQFTPWGSQTWENQQVWDPSTQQYLNRWAQKTELTPESQRALDAQLGLTGDRSELGRDLMARAEQEFGQEMDWSKFQQAGQAVKAPGAVQGGAIAGTGALDRGQYSPEEIQRGVQGQDYQRQLQGEQLARGYDIQGPELNPADRYYGEANDAIYQQWADRALPQQERDTDALRTQLYNMGLKEGDPGYDREMEKLRQSQGDAMRQAQYQATIGAGSEAQRMLGMDAATRQQLTGEQAGLAAFGNQAALGQFGMGAQQGEFANQAADRYFQQALAQGQFGNQAAAQSLAQQLGLGGQRFQESLAAAGFGNEAQQQGWQQQMAGQDQNFQQQMAASQYQTQLRQQQIAEEMQKRGFSLNEINALISGQQVGMPTMPGFNTAAASQGNQALTAAQLTGQSELDRFNAQQAATQGMMSGIGSLAGGFMGFSDRRLKRDIKLLGNVSGVNLYSWVYLWGEPSIGVMADEVPHAIAGKINGFAVVDYRRVW
jgi:hypothetical protein